MEKNGEVVLMVNVVVRMAFVVLMLNSVLFLKAVNLAMENVQKVNVENYGVLVQKDNVVVKKDIVV